MRLTSITRRTLLAAAATLVAGSAWAQAAWPSKPITLIVPFLPEGPLTWSRASWARSWQTAWVNL